MSYIIAKNKEEWIEAQKLYFEEGHSWISGDQELLSLENEYPEPRCGFYPTLLIECGPLLLSSATFGNTVEEIQEYVRKRDYGKEILLKPKTKKEIEKERKRLEFERKWGDG